MKKYLIILLTFGMFFVTGCGNSSGTLTCTKTEMSEDGYSTNTTMVVTYADKIVTKVEQTSIEEMEADFVDTSIYFSQLLAESLNEVDGYNITFEKENDMAVRIVTTIDYTVLDSEKIKETLGSSYKEDALYSLSNITIEDFKETQLDGYTCK